MDKWYFLRDLYYFIDISKGYALYSPFGTTIALIKDQNPNTFKQEVFT